MNWTRLTAVVVIIFNTFMSGSLFGFKLKVIENPQPNLVEKKYIQLKKVRTLNPDLGNGVYLFKPFSLTTDGDAIYIYDNLQAKIIKLDKDLNFVKAYGQRGIGPGEFSGTGKAYPVFIKFGRDGLLYAHDVRAMKIIVLDKDLKYINDVLRVPFAKGAPIVDGKGKKYFIDIKQDTKLEIVDETKSRVLYFPQSTKYFTFILDKPYIKAPVSAVPYFMKQHVSLDITTDSSLLMYFHSYSALVVLKNGKANPAKALWPKDAFKSYRKDLEELRNRNKNLFRHLFIKLLMDEDVGDIFYLHYGKNRGKKMNAIYKFNIYGELLNVYYVATGSSEFFSRFELKVHDLFFAVEDTDLTLYK